VLSLILIVLVVWIVLTVLLAAWTLFFQGYIYSEPAQGLSWRAPAAGTAVTVFLCLWVWLDYRSITDPRDEGRYQSPYSFSWKETETYEHLWIINRDGKEEHYERRGNEYVRKDGRRLPSRPSKIIASHKADGEKRVFEPPRDAKGNFQAPKDQDLRYYDKDNKARYMDESYPGQISISHFGWLMIYLFLNIGFLLAWFLSLWLLLQFQWPHALGLAVVFWLAMILLIVPMVLKPAEDLRKQRLPPRTTAAISPTWTRGCA
jgi:hypothetical protein